MIDVSASEELLVLGLGAPHDEFIAAVCRTFAPSVRTAGPLDHDAEARGREVLPRGACAPLLFTTGALLRATDASTGVPRAVLSLGSCGPCRYAMFEAAWQRALLSEGRPPVRAIAVAQSGAALRAWIDARFSGEGAAQRSAARGLASSATHVRLLEAVAAADALVRGRNRALPRSRRTADVEEAFERATASVCAAIAAGTAPLVALAMVRGWERSVCSAPSRVVARVRLLGDPWSLHTNGDGQLRVPVVLASLGVEVVAPPSLLWARYCLWLARGTPWGREVPATAAESVAFGELDARIVDTWEGACAALDLESGDLPDPAWLAQLAEPFIPSELRGGYGHMEIGLARDAVLTAGTHALLSVKSFGCMPSSGVSDALIGAAIDDALPFLALEVCADGHAARESRLALLAAEALRRAGHGTERGRPSASVSDVRPA